MKEQKAKRTLAIGYKEGEYIPDKKELCELIMRDKVAVSITEQSKYSDGVEKMTFKIIHRP